MSLLAAKYGSVHLSNVCFYTCPFKCSTISSSLFYRVQMAKDSKDAKFELKTLVFNGPSGKDSGHQNTMTQHRISGKPGEGKVPGWMKDEKYLYTDQNVQELVKKVEVPGVGGAEGAKGQGAQETATKRPQHKARIQFKPSPELLKEAGKVTEMLNKLELNDESTGKMSKASKGKSDTEPSGKDGKNKKGKGKGKT